MGISLSFAVALSAQYTPPSGGGGGGTPGGSNTQVQFNDSTAFGGNSGLTFNKSTKATSMGTTVIPDTGITLVTNGSFSSGLTGWSVSGDGTGWSIVGGHAVHSPGSANKLYQNVSVSLYNTYFMRVTVVSQSAGSVAFNLGVDCNSDCKTLAVGTTVYDLIANPDNGPTPIEIAPSSDSTVVVSLVSFYADDRMHQGPAPTSNAYFGVTNDFCSVSQYGNTSYGASSLYTISTGTNNTALGYATLPVATTGSQNVAVGQAALLRLTTGSANNVIGSTAAFGLRDGNSNTVQGSSAGGGLSSGSTNVLIGNSADSPNDNSGGVAVGYQAQSGADGAVSIGAGVVNNVTNTVSVGTNSATYAKFESPTGSTGHALCRKADGLTIGFCSSVVAVDGSCTCN